MNFFEQIISPFIFIIKQIFLFSYELTGNYGVAIILLSFVVSLILLPIFILIEKSKKKDDVVKKKMKPLIDEIKRVYKGQERYYYLKTINRQHNYNSFKALIPILSLLIQIPFFIAAYQFLENFEGLKETSFLFIKDLSLPDGLFGDIHFLPILMTLVNLLTAYLYTRNGNTSERKQMLIVAGAFLILLFNLPSGLVLYWTMNNVFSFFRLFITNKEVFKANLFGSSNFNFDFKASYKKLKIIFIVILAPLLFSQLYWAFSHNFDDIIFRLLIAVLISIGLTLFIWLIINFYKHYKTTILEIKVKPSLFFSLLFLVVYFHLSSQFYYTGENATLSIISLLMLIPIQFIGCIYTIRAKSKSFAYKYTIIIYLVIVVYQLVSLISYINEDISISIFKINLLIESGSFSDILVPGIIFSLISSIYYLRHNGTQTNITARKNWLIFSLSILYIFGVIFFWHPLIVYSSFPANFEFPAYKFFSNNLIPFIISIFSSILLYKILSKKYRINMLQVFLWIVIIVLLYSSIIPFDVGTLQVNFFSKENNLAAETYKYLFEAILLIGIYIIVIRVLKRKYFKQITFVLIILNLFIISQSLYLSVKTGVFFSKGNDNIKAKEIQFSKNNENIVFFIIDGAQGWYMRDIFIENIKLNNLYDGFVWYPNTISTSNYTYASVPGMMCGSDFSIENMNKDEDKTITQKITNATAKFYKKIKDNGYYFTGNNLAYSNIDLEQIDNFLPKWENSWSKAMGLINRNEMWYSRLYENAIFSSSPLFLKPRIYNHNKWFEIGKNEEKGITSTDLLSKYSFITILPEISSSKSNNSNFIYIHSMFAHAPWDLITEDNKLISDVSPYENQKQFIEIFAKWITWMKENEVYDNTKIILVSDHGPSWWHYNKKIEDHNMPLVWSKDRKVSFVEFLRLNPLLMVKDFNSKGKVKEDWRIMSNIDTYSITFDENDPTKNNPSSRTVYTYYTKWHTDLKTRKKYQNYFAFQIKDNVYDINNWKKFTTPNDAMSYMSKNSSISIYDGTKVDLDFIENQRSSIILRIKKNYTWFDNIKEKAEKRGISLDSMLVLSANYVIETSELGYIKERAILIHSIKNNKEWLNNTINDAESRGISLDTMIMKNVNYILYAREE